ncbi:MAG: polyprenyl diphosphate synthase [Elusimicrobiota bacterium]
MLSKRDYPRHIAFIMDGNARWARMRALDIVWGHRKGAQRVEEVISRCSDLGMDCLSLFAFSTENWKRPEKEINALMELFVEYINSRLLELKKNGIRFLLAGRRGDFSEKVNEAFRKAEKETASGKNMDLVFCVNYGGRLEIEDAAARKRKNESISNFFYAPEIPDIDLLVRTSGEQRISNFMLWKLAYSELYFTDTLWPDFTEEEMKKALKSFKARRRKFGMRL